MLLDLILEVSNWSGKKPRNEPCSLSSPFSVDSSPSLQCSVLWGWNSEAGKDEEELKVGLGVGLGHTESCLSEGILSGKVHTGEEVIVWVSGSTGLSITVLLNIMLLEFSLLRKISPV